MNSFSSNPNVRQDLPYNCELCLGHLLKYPPRVNHTINEISAPNLPNTYAQCGIPRAVATEPTIIESY
jgi:hypothetical protein